MVKWKVKLAQLRLLVWKNFLLRRRQPVVVICEILWPLILNMIIVGIRSTRKGSWEAQQREWPTALPSAGYVPWVQTFLCQGQTYLNDTFDVNGFPNFSYTPATTFTAVVQTLAGSGLDYGQLLDLPSTIDRFRTVLQNSGTLIGNNTVNLPNVTLLQQELERQFGLSATDAAALAGAQINWSELASLIILDRSTTQPNLQAALQLCDQLAPFGLSTQCVASVLAASPLFNTAGASFLQDLLNGGVSADRVNTLLQQSNLTANNIRPVFCNTTQFDRVITLPANDSRSKTAVQTALCNITQKQLTEFFADFLANPVVNNVTQTFQQQTGVLNELTSDVTILNESLKLLNHSDLRILVDFVQYALPLLQGSQANESSTVYSIGATFMCSSNALERYDSFNGYQDNVAALGRLPSVLQQYQNVFSTGTPSTVAPITEIIVDDTDVGTGAAEPVTDESDLKKAVNSGAQNADTVATRGLFKEVSSRLLTGALKILYAPNNTLGNMIINQVLEPLVELNQLVLALNSSVSNLTAALRVALPALNQTLSSSAVTTLLNTACTNPTFLSNQNGHRLCEYTVYGRQVFQLPLVVNRSLARQLTAGLPNFTVPEVEAIDSEVSSAVQQLAAQSQSVEQYVRGLFLGMPSEYDLEVLADNEYDSGIIALAGLIFTNLPDNATLMNQVPHVIYKIRQNETFTPSTRYLTRYVWTPGPCKFWCTRYKLGGFVFLQDLLDRAIQELQINSTTSLDPGSWTQEFPYPCYLNDRFASAIASIMPLIMVLGWILSVAMLIKNIVYEKEHRLKEVMKVMGLDSGMHWLAWFINSLLLMSISATLLTAVIKGGDILAHSNTFIIWLYIMVFCISTIMFCFLVSMFFSRANLAACCGAIIFFGCYLPSVIIFVRQDTVTFFEQCLACLLAPAAFGLSTQYVSFYETQGTGLQWDVLYTSPGTNDKLNFALTVWFMVIDCFIYGILVWYLDNVMPGQYGIPRKWYFPFTASYWCGPKKIQLRRGGRRTANDLETLVDNMDLDRASPVSDAGGSVPVEVNTPLPSEAEPSHLKCGVAFHHLVKSYDSSTGVTKLAVDDLCLNFYEGQITSFLGHNGAGKTTTMSVLTGIFPPTSGTAFVYGRDIRTDINEIRLDMGMCPQHNVLFEKMTVQEHLKFYAQVKGVGPSEVKRRMDEWLTEVGLTSKRDCQAKNLSGGMKRKLSVAIAFVGNSSTVILDEPTAGVDPYSRRAIWDMLVRYRNKGRTIILSTHHMDEADILGDRIAIISNGKLRCVGSSLFLKGQYGEGYTLTMVKKPGDTDSTSSGCSNPPPPNNGIGSSVQEDEGVGSMASLSDAAGERLKRANDGVEVADGASVRPRGNGICDSTVVVGVVKSFLGEAAMVEDIGAELMFNLPASGAHDGRFTQLFTYLDEHLQELGIASYGVSDTTLEEVFLKVSDDGSNTNDLADTGGFFASARRRFGRKSEDRAASSVNSPSSDAVSVDSTDDDVPLIGANEASVDNPEEDDSAEDDIDGYIKPADLTAGGSGSYQVTGPMILLQQFRALFLKRFHHARRNRKGFVAQVIVPSIFVALAMVVKLLARQAGNLPSLLLVPSTYPQPKLTPIKNFNLSSPDASSVLNTLKHPCGVSTEHFHLGTKPAACFNYAGDNFTSRYSPSYRNTHIRFQPQTYPDEFDKDSRNLAYDCSRQPKCQMYKAWCQEPLPRTIDEATVVGGVTLQDIGKASMDTWLMDTTLFFHRRRWGAISTGADVLSAAKANRSSFNFLNRLARRQAARAWINTNGFHSYPIYVNVLNNAILRSSLNNSYDPTQFGISAYNQPFNKTTLQLTQDYLKTGVDIIISVCIIFAMSFVPASFVLFLINERTTGAKHLQRLAGVNGFVYWFSSYVWDMCNYLVTVVVCILIFLAFNIEVYTSSISFPAVFTLFLFYGWSITPLMYPATFVFNTPSTAYVFLVAVNIFIGVFGTLATFILQLFPDDEELTAVNSFLRLAFLAFPNYCLGRGLMDIAYQYYLETLSASIGGGLIPFKRPWGFDIDQIGRNLLAMAISGVVFFCITLVLESQLLQALYRRITGVKEAADGIVDDDDVDDDVAREKRRVASGRAADDTIVLNNFTKVYGTRWKNHCAVRKLNLGVPKGECFGLLGVNGAGKTSTFKMLTGEESVSSGDAFLNGLSVVTEKLRVQQKMGYCPQFDGLDDLLTGREHLTMYARLRGVPEKECKQVVNWAMDKLSLTRYADKCAGSYSGGNKRKLSTGMALIGKPPVIFLDEPTTGMDPKARRFLWTIVTGLVRIGHCIILTSHSMEECEALCQRIAIMVNGTFKCLGSPQHLRNKFGDGYTVTVRLTGSNPDLSPVKEFFSETFPGARLQREHHNMVVYQLPNTFLSLSHIFHAFEEVRRHMPIEDYSVSQTTLDQVFIGFAAGQADDGESEGTATGADTSSTLSSAHRTNVVTNPSASALTTPAVHFSVNGDVTIDGPDTVGTRL